MSSRQLLAAKNAMRLLVSLTVVLGASSVSVPGLTAASTITHVQSSSATPQSPQSSVAVRFTAAQTAGNLNVVAVGWNDSTARVASVTDSSQNTYALAVGPTVVGGFGSQSIYYARNIAASSANTVTVTFSAAATFPDIRILEYSGADANNPVDVSAANSGSSASANSGTATSTNATDLIFGASLVATGTAGPGTGFTRRVMTTPDGDIAEDRMVTSVGSYAATAPVAPSGPWIMQMVAFRTASTDSTPPTAPSNLTAAVNGTAVNLAWTASTDDVGVAGYRVERCQAAGCTSFGEIARASGTVTTYTDASATVGSYSYRVRAVDSAANFSPYSNVATTSISDNQPPSAPTGLTAGASATTIGLSWTASSDNVGVSSYLIERCEGAGCTTFSQVATSTSTSYSDKSLPVDSFSYRVRASDAAANLSPYSNVAVASTTSASSTALAAYGFGEGSGTTTADASANNITGTVQGATSWTASGKSGNALTFDGASGYVDLGRPAPLTTTGSMSWEAWVFPTGTPADDGQIVAFSSNTDGWQLKTTSDTGPRTFGVAVTNASGVRTQRYGTTVLSLNTWYHVAGVYNAAAQTLDVYVNGVLDNASLVGTVPTAMVVPASANVNIGRRAGGFYFIGTLDEIRVYGRALSAADIQADMNTPVGAVADTQAPTPPSGLSATAASGSQVNLAWTASTDNIGVTNYLVEDCSGAGCSNFAQVTTSKKTTLGVTGLSAGTTYSFRVRATDAVGNPSDYSNIATVSTPAPAPPTAPGTLSATAATASQINVAWGAATADLGVATYTLERCQGAGCSNFAGIAALSSATLSYSDTALSARTSYSYRVRATDTAGTAGPYSNTATAATPNVQPPTTPSNLTATAVSSTEIDLAWGASTSSLGLANYVLQRCQGAACSTFATIASPTGTSYSDSGLTTGSAYSYQVQAADTAGNTSAFSNIASATLQNGLVAAYGFNEGAGATTSDASSNGITGSVQNAAWTTAGKFGTALSFDGGNSFVDLGRPVALTSTGSMSWEAWVFPTGTPGDDGQIIALSNDSTGWEFKTTPDTGPRTFGVAVAGANGSRTQRYSTTRLNLNTWYHVAGVYNATAQTLDVYVNGALDDGLLVGSVPSSMLIPAGVNVNIGQRSGGFSFIGTIDEARIYSRALTPTEIQSDMNTPLASPIASVAPGSLDFGTQPVGASAPPQGVTLSNTGTAVLNISSIGITGAGAGSYSQSNTCPASLAPGASCTVSVTFAPAAQGAQSASLAFTDNATNAHQVTLTGTGAVSSFTVSPRAAALTPIVGQQFSAGSTSVTWSVDGIVGGSATVGSISASGMYTPPSAAGAHSVTATATDGSGATASATAYVSTYGGTFTRDVSQKRIGVNDTETVLTPANVNANRFGKLYSFPTDGVSDASPLYVANVNVPGKGARNVVYVATEHDSVFAFDADNQQAGPLWQVSFINPGAGVTTVPPGDTGECCDIQPEIGITSSPVIDPSTNTLYVVAKTKEPSGYFHRLHALDLATGAEKLGGPVVLQGSVAGSGTGSLNGQVGFESLHENQRAALLLLNGVVYVAFGSHGDVNPYHGWVFGYNASTLQQSLVFNTSPDDSGVSGGSGGQGAGIWQSGDGLATDDSGNIFFVTGNGTFDADTAGRDYGNTLMKISPTGGVLDFFTPHDQASLNAGDIDFGSGGVLLLPDQAGGHPHLAITAGKNATVYVIDRDAFGGYNPNGDTQVVQALPNMFPHGDLMTGNFKAPVYWNGNVYFSADADFIKMFSLTNGLLSTAPTSQSSWVANYPGATLGLSANGSSNGILWAVQRVDTNPAGQGVVGPGVLHAFDAQNLGNELYNSAQSGTRDTMDRSPKWAAPLVANGKVFVTGLSNVVVYGPLP